MVGSKISSTILIRELQKMHLEFLLRFSLLSWKICFVRFTRVLQNNKLTYTLLISFALLLLHNFFRVKSSAKPIN